MRFISTEKCFKCGSPAKGLIYTKQGVTYYCKKCLRKNTKQEEELLKNNGIK
jgi:late competence protein required for DNA uptake (superfamily II DNA/RNA helicase)